MDPFPYHIWVKIWIPDTLIIQISFCFQYGLKEHLLRVSFNSETGEDRISDGRGQVLINVKYKNGVLPVESNSHVYHNCTQTFDRWDQFLQGTTQKELDIEWPFNPHPPFLLPKWCGSILCYQVFAACFMPLRFNGWIFFHLSLGLNFRYGYFVVKTAMPSAFSAKNQYRPQAQFLLRNRHSP